MRDLAKKILRWLPSSENDLTDFSRAILASWVYSQIQGHLTVLALGAVIGYLIAIHGATIARMINKF